MNRLVLFDIDGTLVRRAGPHHRDALTAGIRKVLGLETTTDGIPVHGMLDQDIVTQMLAREGVSKKATAAAMDAIRREAERVYLRTCPELRRRTCPYVRSVLRRLGRQRVPLAVVTGNFTRIGWKKLERAGLASAFIFGSFAETARTRAGLAKLAIRQARQRGLIGPGAEILLIGDAPSDILAAKANGIVSVAVATGISTADELLAHEPDHLLETLREFRF